MTDATHPLLRLSGVRKRYVGVQALAGVDFDVDAGEVHALLGENGAGKSTLMKVIAGSVVPEDGHMALDGEPVPFGSPQLARARGIGIVYQELSLVPSLSVAENVLLGRWPATRLGLVDWRRLRAAARASLERVGLDIDPSVKVNRLGIAERQLTEITKALSGDARVLLFDEPTSALSDRESRRLFQVIRDLAAAGVGIVYVSHRLPEVLEVATRVTVLRDGHLVDTVAAADATEEHLAQLMVGRAVTGPSGAASHTPTASRGKVALRADGLGRPPRLRDIDLELHAGEVVCVFGLVGAGRSRVARTLFGMEPATEGTVTVFGEPVTIRSPADAVAAGIGYLGEDRAGTLVPRMSMAQNITLASLPRLGRGPLLDFAEERRLAERYADELAIRVSSIDALAETLSGGNQQKVLLGRWLCSRARILILDDPTRGIDVGAKEEVFRLIRELAASQVAILYLTSEIKEARALSDRILVMAKGSIIARLASTASDDEIMTAAGGVHG